MSFANAWVLWLLPLAALPFVMRSGEPLRNAWIALAPRDAAPRWRSAGVAARWPPSRWLRWCSRWPIRIAPNTPSSASAKVRDRVAARPQPQHGPRLCRRRAARASRARQQSRDAQLLLQPGAGAAARVEGPGGAPVARAEFTAKRAQDRFALIVFSALPIPVLGFTQKQEVIQAAISAGNVGRGLSETNIGLALERALAMYEDRPCTGSRIVMLVSDGGDRIDLDTRERVAAAARKQRVAIYWLYLRTGNSPGLQPAAGDSPAAIESVPELMLNRFFESLETPYRAYEAGNSEALQQAIADVDRLENLPIAYLTSCRSAISLPWCHGVALACVLLLLGASVEGVAPMGLISRTRVRVVGATGRIGSGSGGRRRAARVGAALERADRHRRVDACRGGAPPQVRFAHAAAQAASGAQGGRAAPVRLAAGRSCGRAGGAVQQCQPADAAGHGCCASGHNPARRSRWWNWPRSTYREVPRRDPGHWNARYNLERAQRLVPDPRTSSPSRPARRASPNARRPRCAVIRRGCHERRRAAPKALIPAWREGAKRQGCPG